MVPRSLSMLALISSCMAEEFLQSMRPVGVMTPFLVAPLQDILVSLKVADSVMPLWGISGTPCLSALSLSISVPSGPEDAESHRNLHRHGADIPGSLILHLFSIRPVRFVLIYILLVLFVNGLTPAQFDFSLVHFCLGGPFLAVSRSEWPRVVSSFFVHGRMFHMTRTVSSRFVSISL